MLRDATICRKTPDGGFLQSLRFSLVSRNQRSRFPPRYAAAKRRPASRLAETVSELTKAKPALRTPPPAPRVNLLLLHVSPMNRPASCGDGSLFAHYGERVDAEVISPIKRRICRILPKPLRASEQLGVEFRRAPAFSHSLDAERFTSGGVELHFTP